MRAGRSRGYGLSLRYLALVAAGVSPKKKSEQKGAGWSAATRGRGRR